MAPKGGSGGGKVSVSGGGGGGGGGDNNSISVGEAIAIVVGIIGGPILIVFLYCVIKDGLNKFQKRLQRRAIARMQRGGETTVELDQPLPAQDPPQVEQLVAAPEPTHPHFDKMVYSGSLSMTHPTTPAYDTGDLYRPS